MPEVPPPSVSVVIPCYRQSHFLSDAIGSALQQDHPKVEVVVVDDGSPDNAEEHVRRFPGVVYIRQANAGLAAARNAGLRVSTGDFVTFLDADDRLLPGAITAGMSLFRQNPRFGFVAGHFRFIGPNGDIVASPAARASSSNHYMELIRDYFVGPPGAIIFRRAALEQVGSFDPSISQAADYEMALRVARDFPISVHDRVVLEYRQHGANMSADAASMLATTMTALRRQWPFVRGTTQGRLAYKSGVRHWQESWGEPLVQKVVADARDRKLKEAGRGLGTLFRYHRQGLVEAARALVSAGLKACTTRW